MTEEEKYNARACEITHKGIEETLKEHGTCIKEITKTLQAIENQSPMLVEMLSTINKRQESHDRYIDELRQKPAKQWGSISNAVLQYIVLGVLGYLLFK